MNLAEQIEAFISKGFSEERAETIVLMREAAIVMFEAFPKVLLMVGGASLILFQSSVRHSADLDFAKSSKLAMLTTSCTCSIEVLGSAAI
jgi:hypothetical protein